MPTRLSVARTVADDCELRVRINPSAPADTVSIGRAEYTASKGELQVEATSTIRSATLNVHVASTHAWIGSR